MSVPSPDFLAAGASTTSSGFADGLGRRVLAFDREVGSMLERLVLRPEIAAFEKSLRARVEQVAALEDQRIARPRTVEHDTDGALVVVSEFVPGSRLSDLLDVSAGAGVIPGIDAACGYLLDVLPALCGLHGGAAFAHGTIAPSRTVLTPAGEVVLLDAIYGDALSHLRYSRQRLWTDFGVAAPPSAGAPRLGFEADVAQVALSGMMLVIGRPLGPHEYPDSMPAIMREVAEAAQIRGSARFADGLLHFFHRALALPGSRPYTSADDALIDLRELGNELGTGVCRRALVEFVEQMESGGQVQTGDFDAIIADIESYGLVPERHDQDSETLETASEEETAQDLDQGIDAEIDLEELVEEPQYDLSPAIDISDPAIAIEPATLTWPDVEVRISPAIAQPDPSETAAPEASAAVSSADLPADVDHARAESGHPESDAQAISEEPTRAEAFSATATTPAPDTTVVQPAAPTAREATLPAAENETTTAAPESAPMLPSGPSSATSAETDRSALPATAAAREHEQDTGSGRNVRSRRAKRTRSTRARKDKLRSVAAAPAEAAAPSPVPTPAAPAPPEPAAPAATVTPAPPAEKPVVQPSAPPPPGESWLVRPDRAAAFEPPVADSAPPAAAPVRPAAAAAVFEQPAAPFTQPAVPFSQPASPAFAHPGAAAYSPPPPAYAPPAVPSAFSQSPAAVGGYSPPTSPAQDPFFRPQAPIGVAAAAPEAWTPSNATQHASYPTIAPQNTPLKLKEPATSRPRGTRAPAPVTDIYSTPAPPTETREVRSQFPWKMAASAVALIVVAVIGGRMLLLPNNAGAGKNGLPTETAIPSTRPAPAAALPAASGKTGRLEIETQPAGARVLLDGKPAGESPLALDGVPVGRHTLTFVSPSGSVKRTVRIEAGRTVRLDVPIFSGWVGIFAPFVVEVSENGRGIGTTEDPRIMLSPGSHVLTLSNKALGYTSVHTVEIVPGEVRSVTLDPRGSVNLNASPWAEVWIDGKKAGDTPIANHPMPLGTREIVFRHPQFGERKVVVTVKADGPAAVSVDMARRE